MNSIDTVFIHLERSCGNWFLKNILYNVYGKENVDVSSFFSSKDTPFFPKSLYISNNNEWRSLLSKSLDESFGKFTGANLPMAIRAHCSVDKFSDSRFDSAKKIILVRDPVVRFISHFCFLKHTREFVERNVTGEQRDAQLKLRDMSIYDLAEFDLFSNMYTRYVGGDISSMSFALAVEDFPRSYAVMSEYMGWPKNIDHKFKQYERSKYSEYLEDKSLIEIIIRNNKEDIRLHELLLEKPYFD